MTSKVRHRYMLSRVLEAFDVPLLELEASIDRHLVMRDINAAIDHFLSKEGPTNINFTYDIVSTNQSASNMNVDGSNRTIQLKVISDDSAPSPSVFAYFMKAKRVSDNTDEYVIDPTKANDGSLVFGVLRQPLESLDAMIKHLYKPLVQEMNCDSWGDAHSEFLSGLNTFSKSLEENIRSMHNGFELKMPDERIEQQGAAAINNPALVTKAINILQEWCRSIERYLDDSDSRTKYENQDLGLDSELTYWKSRTQR